MLEPRTSTALIKYAKQKKANRLNNCALCFIGRSCFPKADIVFYCGTVLYYSISSNPALVLLLQATGTKIFCLNH